MMMPTKFKDKNGKENPPEQQYRITTKEMPQLSRYSLSSSKQLSMSDAWVYMLRCRVSSE